MLPVKTNAKNSKVFETSDKEFLISAAISQLFTGTIKDGHLTHPAPVPVVQSSGRGVSTSQTRSLRQDLLQLLSRSSSDQGAYQGQGVGVEICLRRVVSSNKELAAPGNSYRGHERVEYRDSEGSATGEWLGEIQLSVRIVIVVIRINELDIAVIDQLRDHGDAGSEACSPPLQYNGLAERACTFIGSRI